MNRPIAAMLAASLLVIPQAVSSQAASPKVGAKCTKAAAISKSKTSVLVCTKTAKGLTWQVQKKPSAVKPTPAAVKPTTADIALAKVIAAPAGTEPKARVVYEFGPKADPAFAQVLRSGGEAAMKFWAGTLVADKAIPIIYSTASDFKFVMDTVAAYGHSSPVYVDNVYKRLAEEGENANLSGVSTAPDRSVVMQYIRSSTKNTGFLDQTMIPHEFSHLIQAQLTDYDFQRLPCWAIEGGAQYFAYAISVKLMGLGSTANRHTHLQMTSKSVTFNKWSASSSDWLAAIVDMEGQNTKSCWDERLGYTAGMLMSEKLIADHGQSAVLQWWASSATQNWKASFATIFKISVDEWYKTVAVPYLISEYKRTPRQ